jgi:hypothetical protein
MATVHDELEDFYRFAAEMRAAHAESFSLERAYQAYLNDQWEPQTPLGKALKQRRAEFLAAGGTFKLMTAEEIDAEVRERCGSLGD